jgi:glutamate racemase
MTSLRIGIFDSGVGGLSVLRALQPRLPHATLHYVADAGHAPYGDRDEAYVRERALRIGRHLVRAGARVVVVACNTATAAAVAALRAALPGVPVVGVEPGIKPAVAATRSGRIGVMATATTLRSARFLALLQTHAGGAEVHLQACHGLATAIETGDLDAPALRERVERHAAPLRDAGVDTVVLGCTHYPLVRGLIEQAFGSTVQVIDTAEAVARRTVEVCAALPAEDAPSGEVFLETTGDADALRTLAARWLPFACVVSAAPADL